jgi:hypothetical protein
MKNLQNEEALNYKMDKEEKKIWEGLPLKRLFCVKGETPIGLHIFGYCKNSSKKWLCKSIDNVEKKETTENDWVKTLKYIEIYE